MLTENTPLPFSSDRFSAALPRINQATCCVDSTISFTFPLVGTKFLNLVFFEVLDPLYAYTFSNLDIHFPLCPVGNPRMGAPCIFWFNGYSFS